MSPSRKPRVTKIVLGITFLAVLAMVACGESQKPATTTATGAAASNPAPTETSSPETSVPTTGDLEPIVVPTLPAEIPGYTELDPATGLHVTGTAQVVDLAEYRLEVRGKVAQELSLSYDELRSLPKVTATPTLVCPGFFEDTATWSGVPLHTILEMAEIQPDAERLVLTSVDGYATFVRLEEALQPENFLAYELAGEPLPVLHGFPLRAVFPDKGGSSWVKWLVEIEVE